MTRNMLSPFCTKSVYNDIIIHLKSGLEDNLQTLYINSIYINRLGDFDCVSIWRWVCTQSDSSNVQYPVDTCHDFKP